MTNRFRSVAAAALLAAVPALAGEFQYAIPAGWIDLKNPSAQLDTSTIPTSLLQDAADFRFAVVAMDPADSTLEKPGATMNVVEVATTAPIESDMIVDYGDRIVGELRNAGMKAHLIDVRLGAIGGVRAGVVNVEMEGTGGLRRMRQYFVPGRKGSAILTFAAPAASFARYEPIFVAAANATRGAARLGFDWSRVVVSALLAGLVGGVGGLVLAMVRKRRDARAQPESAAPLATPMGETLAVATAAPAVAPVRKATGSRAPTKYTWQCDACGKPVPIRLDQCRCGGKKPG